LATVQWNSKEEIGDDKSYRRCKRSKEGKSAQERRASKLCGLVIPQQGGSQTNCIGYRGRLCDRERGGIEGPRMGKVPAAKRWCTTWKKKWVNCDCLQGKSGGG